MGRGAIGRREALLCIQRDIINEGDIGDGVGPSVARPAAIARRHECRWTGRNNVEALNRPI